MVEWDKSIQEKFNKVITHSQGIKNPQTDELFNMWAIRKNWFRMRMKEQLIYEFPQPVTLEMDTETKKDRLAHFFDWVEHFSVSLRAFLKDQEDGFYDNKTVSNWYMDNDIIIPAGMKISKAIGRYWKDDLDPVQIDTVQCEISRLVQENKVTGTLCLSIHPLDYLSLSENNHNWRSCHALDGEYRAGNLSYMLDQVTVIAYIKSESNVILPRFPEDVPWNNKKWRCLFFFDFSRGLVYAGRQYPFFSENALNLVRQCLFEPLNYFMNKTVNSISKIGIPWKHNCFTGYCDINGETVYFNEPHIFDAATCIPLNQWVQDANDSMHFNDLLRSSVYTPWTLRFKSMDLHLLMQQPPLIIGDAIPCLECGKHHVCNSDVVVCEDCALNDENVEADWIGYCAECGARIIKDDSYRYDDDYYCDACVDKHTHHCEKCGASILDLEDNYCFGKHNEILCWSCWHNEHLKSTASTSTSNYNINYKNELLIDFLKNK